MKIELVKQIEPTGKVWYLVREDGWNRGAFNENQLQQATDFYETLIKSDGKPQETVISFQEIPD